jgi:hypothetical protein
MFFPASSYLCYKYLGKVLITWWLFYLVGHKEILHHYQIHFLLAFLKLLYIFKTFHNFGLKAYKFLLLELIIIFYNLYHVIFYAYQSKAYVLFYLFLIFKYFHEDHNFLVQELFVKDVKCLNKNSAFIQTYVLFFWIFISLKAFLLMIFKGYKFQYQVFFFYFASFQFVIKRYF